MKKQNTQSKIIIALSAIIVLLVAFSATITFAWFTASKNATSGDMTFGKLALDSSELTVDDGDTNSHMTVSSGDITGLVPGCTVDIDGGTVSLANNVDAYVRYKITISAAGVAGATIATDFAALLATPQSGGWVSDSNPGTALGSADSGWFYVKVVAGDGTAAALTGAGLPEHFTFPTTLGNSWQEKVVTFTLTAQAIQADHLTDGSSAIANGTVVASNAQAGEVTVAAVASATAWATVGNNGVPQQQP